MKSKRKIKIRANKLDHTLKYVNVGDNFLPKSVCQLRENVGHGEGWFIGLRKGGVKNTVKCRFDEFKIYTKDGNEVEVQEEF